jgi:urea transport system substrate-binding protein
MFFFTWTDNHSLPPIKVGVLHSLTGTMAISAKPVINATLMAIDEINQTGGLLGRPVQTIVADGKSDPAVFAHEAERLIAEENVSVIFGCWTSSCRKAVKPVVEHYHNLLVYPLQYEGLEQSPNILYMGSTPNQQIIPALLWSFEHFGKRLYLVGSDYVFPHISNLIIRDIVWSSEVPLKPSPFPVYRSPPGVVKHRRPV